MTKQPDLQNPQFEESGMLKLPATSKLEKPTFRQLISTQSLVRLTVLSALLLSAGDTTPASDYATVNVSIEVLTPKERRQKLSKTMGQRILDADLENFSETDAVKQKARIDYITKRFDEYDACQKIADDEEAVECFKALKAKDKNFWN